MDYRATCPLEIEKSATLMGEDFQTPFGGKEKHLFDPADRGVEEHLCAQHLCQSKRNALRPSDNLDDYLTREQY